MEMIWRVTLSRGHAEPNDSGDNDESAPVTYCDDDGGAVPL